LRWSWVRRDVLPSMAMNSCRFGHSAAILRLDVEGNLWCGWAGGEGRVGVMIFAAAAAPASMLRLVISMGYPPGN
jgi:hypothetical protein